MRLAFFRLCQTLTAILATAPMTLSVPLDAGDDGGGRREIMSGDSPYLPSFLPTPLNVTALSGEEAVLQCAIENRGTRTVVWRRASQPNPLTIGEHTFVGDKRFFVQHKKHSLEWNLHIRDATPSDSGTYECHVTTRSRDVRQLVTLHVDEMKYVPVNKPGIRISGSRFVERGNTLLLTCNATGYDYPPDDLDWFKDGIKLSNTWRRHLSKHVSLSERTIVGALKMSHADVTDTGTYVCRASDMQIASVNVHVLIHKNRKKLLPNPKPGIQITGSHYVEKGNTLILTCNATGYDYPPDDLDWFKDGLKLSDSWRLHITKHVSLSGKTIVSTLEVSRAIMTDAGTYVCRASDMQITSVKINVLNTTSTNEKRAHPNNQSTVGPYGSSSTSPLTVTATSLLTSLLVCLVTSSPCF